MCPNSSLKGGRLGRRPLLDGAFAPVTFLNSHHAISPQITCPTLNLAQVPHLHISPLSSTIPVQTPTPLRTTNFPTRKYRNYTMAAAQAYPPGGTFLNTLKKSFTDVPVDKEKENAVATTEFLEAAESLTTLFGIHFFSLPL